MKELKDFVILPNSVVRDADMAWPEKLVYIYLMSLSGCSGWCFPSVRTMSRELRMAKSTITGCVKRLVEKGLIQYARRKMKDGRHLSNMYLVTNPCYDMSKEDAVGLKEYYLSDLINSPESDIIYIGDENGKD